MKFKKGWHKIASGYDALIAQIKSMGPNAWVLRGCIMVDGVSVMHQWHVTGESYTGHPGLNLVE